MLRKFLNQFKRQDQLRITAITIARNEELFIGRHIEHLMSQGIELCLIDNESTDNTVKIAERYLGKGVLKIVHLAYPGEYNLDYLLKKVEEVVTETKSDWFIFLNPDEFPLPVKPYATLKESFIDLTKRGFNSVNFDEFVFIPENDEISYEGRDFISEMKYYYFFDPSPLHRVIAWKRSRKTDLRTSAGHKVKIPYQKIYPENFAFKHYVILSRKHAIVKYGNRMFSKACLDKGWHGTRVVYTADRICIPPLEILKKYREGEDFDRSDPCKTHLFIKKEDHFSEYKKKFIFGKTNSSKSAYLDSTLENISPLPFIIGSPGPGVRVIKLILEKILSFNFIENNRLFEELFTGLSNETTESIRSVYKAFAGNLESGCIGDSSKENNLWIAGISDLLPEARFIHVIEDGRKLLALKKSEGPLTNSEIEKLSTEWLINVIEVKQQSQFCKHFMEIKMEDFYKDPMKKVKELAVFLNKSNNLIDKTSMPENEFNTYWQKAYYNEYKGIQTEDNAQAGNSFISSLTKDEISTFEAIAGLTLNDLGYQDDGYTIHETRLPKEYPTND